MDEKRAKDNLILQLTFQFSLKIMEYSEQLESQKKFVIARQILRSGTSIGVLARESQNAESKADFLHKLKIAAKESAETEYWLLLCKHSKNYPDTNELLQLLESISKVLNKIIHSLKK